MFCRLKDCPPLAARYDKLAPNLLGNIQFAAIIMG